MRTIVLAAIAVMLASCTTSQMPATTAATGPQQASTSDGREPPIPPAFRAPRQQSGNGWPNIGYSPYGNN
jgi:hypothetical protein